MNDEELKRLLLKKINGEISAEEAERLQRWMDGDVRNRELVERICSRDFLQHAILDKNNRQQTAVWQRIYRRIGYVFYTRFTQSRYWQMAAAAALVGLLIGGLYLIYNTQYEEEPLIEAGRSQAFITTTEMTCPLNGLMLDLTQHTEQLPDNQCKRVEISPNLYTVITVPRGSEYRVLLEDSTWICLNAGSSLVLPSDFSPTNRHLNLSGEAYFDVHKDEQHPFVIHTERINVTVLGTTLNVEAYDDDAETCVTLVNGRVRLDNGLGQYDLQPGNVAVIGRDRRVRTEAADLYERTAWTQNRLVFDGRTMQEVMKKLGRWYNFEASFSNDYVRNSRVTIDIDRCDTFNKIARLIECMGELQVKITKNGILITQNSLIQ